jgi:lipopolysaccharide/colanic/teichoic acid biosynthesis glycosyltransferase
MRSVASEYKAFIDPLDGDALLKSVLRPTSPTNEIHIERNPPDPSELVPTRGDSRVNPDSNAQVLTASESTGQRSHGFTALIRRGVSTSVQWSGRLAVVVASIITFDIGSLLHRQFRGAFDVAPAGMVFFCGLMTLTAFLVGFPEGPVSKRQAFAASILASTATTIIALFVMVVLAPSLLPRFFLLVAPPIEAPLLFIAWLYARSDDAREQQKSRVFAITSSSEAIKLREQINLYPERPGTFVGSFEVDLPKAELFHLTEMVQASDATILVLSIRAQDDPRIMEIVRDLHRSGVRVRTLVGFYEQWLGKLSLQEVSNMALMVDHFDIHRMIYGRVKRAMDIGAGFVGALAMFAVLPFVLIGNVFGNRGPLFFSQARVGRDGAIIKIRKLRTMKASAPQMQAGESNEVPALGRGEWTQPKDPRITRFGRVLRRTHLDELPQCLNMLAGDLSLVGPRPEQPHYVEELRKSFPFYDLRHGVRPGLTGWAQVKWPYGSSIADAEQKLQYDLFYVVNQGLAMDLKTIGRTVRSIILRGGR